MGRMWTALKPGTSSKVAADGPFEAVLGKTRRTEFWRGKGKPEARSSPPGAPSLLGFLTIGVLTPSSTRMMSAKTIPNPLSSRDPLSSRSTLLVGQVVKVSLEPGAGLVDGHRPGVLVRFVRPVVTDPAHLVGALADAHLNPAPAFAADLVDHDGRVSPAGRAVVLRAVVRAERRLERGEEADDVGPSEVLMRVVEVLARHGILLEEVRRRGDRGLQPVDRGSGGPVLAPDLRDVLVPVKPTVRHIRRSS